MLMPFPMNEYLKYFWSCLEHHNWGVSRQWTCLCLGLSDVYFWCFFGLQFVLNGSLVTRFSFVGYLWTFWAAGFAEKPRDFGLFGTAIFKDLRFGTEE